MNTVLGFQFLSISTFYTFEKEELFVTVRFFSLAIAILTPSRRRVVWRRIVLLFVCKVELISIELPMVVNGAALMKLRNLGGAIQDLR